MNKINWPNIKFGPVNLWSVPRLWSNKVFKECSNPSCKVPTVDTEIYCNNCKSAQILAKTINSRAEAAQKESTFQQPPVAYDRRMSDKYPKYYKRIPDNVKEVDIYAVCQMFPVDDPTGCINHARKKLLVPGTRTGGKSFYKDVKEARDTLNRWLELNPEPTDV